MAQKIVTALVIGASRGLGNGLVHELADRDVEVTGTIRNAAQMEVFTSGGPGHVTWQLLDIAEEKSVHNFVHNLQHPRYDLIFINAGIMGPEHHSAKKATFDEIGTLFLTNTIAPVRLAEQLTTHLNPDGGTIAFMTSRLGSVSLNTDGGYDLYRASKAALNSLTRTYYAGLGETKLTVISMHPGWVRTDMGGSGATLDVKTSVKGIVDVLEKQAGSGGHAFLDYQGNTLGW